MTKWEYCAVIVTASEITLEELQKHQAGEIVVQTPASLHYYGTPGDHPVDDASTTIGQLGQEGWEMVSYANTGDRESFVFKRPHKIKTAESDSSDKAKSKKPTRYVGF